jgi:hypothetical protein
VTALSDALAAAQARAVAALAKQYVGGQIASGEVVDRLRGCGLTDDVDTRAWLASLDVIREAGAQAPTEARPAPSSNGEPARASQRQLDYIGKLSNERGVVVETAGLTSARASEIINELKAGTYDPAKDEVPF